MEDNECNFRTKRCCKEEEYKITINTYITQIEEKKNKLNKLQKNYNELVETNKQLKSKLVLTEKNIDNNLQVLSKKIIKNNYTKQENIEKTQKTFQYLYNEESNKIKILKDKIKTLEDKLLIYEKEEINDSKMQFLAEKINNNEKKNTNWFKECPKIKCITQCENGYIKDSKGCQTCNCIKKDETWFKGEPQDKITTTDKKKTGCSSLQNKKTECENRKDCIWSPKDNKGNGTCGPKGVGRKENKVTDKNTKSINMVEIGGNKL